MKAHHVRDRTERDDMTASRSFLPPGTVLGEPVRPVKPARKRARRLPATTRAAATLVVLLAALLLLLGVLSAARSLAQRLRRPQRREDALIPSGMFHARLRHSSPVPDTPLRIPCSLLLLHPNGKHSMHPSWRSCSAYRWTTRVYGLRDGDALVYSDFREYSATYTALRRTRPSLALTFMKYLLALKHGGVLADASALCRQPLDSWLSPHDSLVAAWNARPLKHRRRSALRSGVRRQLPATDSVLHTSMLAVTSRNAAVRAMCDRINSISRNGEWFDEELLWTHSVLEYQESSALGRDVRLLSSAAVSMRHSGAQLIQPKPTPHLFAAVLNSVVTIASWPKFRPLALVFLRAKESKEPDLDVRPEAPVSLSAEKMDEMLAASSQKQPWYSLLLPMSGGNHDEAAALMQWGTYQAGIGAVSGHSSLQWVFNVLDSPPDRDALKDQLFVDMGAGSGYFSVAVGSRGHKAIAIEQSGENVARIGRSVPLNQLQDRVSVVHAAIGRESQTLHQALDQVRRSDQKSTSAVPKRVSVLRIAAANGSECRVLVESIAELEEQPPRLIVLEVAPLACEYNSGLTGVLELLTEELGVGELYHSGPACQRRLRGARATMRNDRSDRTEAEWCTLQRGQKSELAHRTPRASPPAVETVLAMRAHGVASTGWEEPESYAPQLSLYADDGGS